MLERDGVDPPDIRMEFSPARLGKYEIGYAVLKTKSKRSVGIDEITREISTVL